MKNSNIIVKAPKVEPEYKALHRVADEIQPILEVNLVTGIESVKNTVNLNEIKEAIENGRVSYLDNVINWNKFDTTLKASLVENYLQGIEGGALATKQFFRDSIDIIIPTLGKAEIPFTMDNPAIQNFVEKRVTFLSAKIESESMQAVEFAITNSFNGGMNVHQTAKQIKNSIGLNQRQSIALTNFRAGLEADGLSVANINKQVNEYSERMLKARAKMISRTESITAVNHGQIELWKQNIEANYLPNDVKKRWLVTPDGKACIICEELAGQEVFINKDFHSSIIGAIYAPSAHPNCYDKETEVLTSNGWQLFKDVLKTDKILSVDLQTLNAEYVNQIDYIEYHYEGEMHHYKSNICDLLTTPNHKNVVKFGVSKKGRKDAGKWLLLEDRELPTSNFSMLGSIPNWQGEDNVDLDFIRFMAVYLSDGNIIVKSKTRAEISIARKRDKHKKEIVGILERLFNKVWVGKDKIYMPIDINSSLYAYLAKLGKAKEKYIPEDIKQCNKELLEEFIKFYSWCDGHVRKGKLFKGYLFKDSVSLVTSSDRLASDLGEIILKIGKRPSYSRTEKKLVKFSNGEYISNPSWIIRVNNTQNVRTGGAMKRATVPYNDKVYCVELEKNNTLFVRRNGKVLLSGNCRCALELVFPK